MSAARINFCNIFLLFCFVCLHLFLASYKFVSSLIVLIVMTLLEVS